MSTIKQATEHNDRQLSSTKIRGGLRIGSNMAAFMLDKPRTLAAYGPVLFHMYLEQLKHVTDKAVKAHIYATYIKAAQAYDTAYPNADEPQEIQFIRFSKETQEPKNV